ncbi:hypothetical protein D9M68_553340 [compost metagenome]
MAVGLGEQHEVGLGAGQRGRRRGGGALQPVAAAQRLRPVVEGIVELCDERGRAQRLDRVEAAEAAERVLHVVAREQQRNAARMRFLDQRDAALARRAPGDGVLQQQVGGGQRHHGDRRARHGVQRGEGLRLGLGRQRAEVAADHAAFVADLAQQARGGLQADGRGVEFLVHVQVDVEVARLRRNQQVAQGVLAPVGGVHEAAEQRVRSGGLHLLRQAQGLRRVFEQRQLDERDLLQSHAAGPFLRQLGHHGPGHRQRVGLPPVDVRAHVRGAAFPRPLQAARCALAHVGGRPVHAVGQHRVDRAEQAGLHLLHARQRERLVQVRVRVDEGGEGERAGEVPAGARRDVPRGLHRPDAAGLDGDACEFRHPVALRPVGGQQPARQPCVVQQRGRVHAKRAPAEPAGALVSIDRQQATRTCMNLTNQSEQLVRLCKRRASPGAPDWGGGR